MPDGDATDNEEERFSSAKRTVDVGPQTGDKATPEPKAQLTQPIVEAAAVVINPPKPRATPLEGLQNLCAASGVSESELIAFLKPQRSEGVFVNKLEFLTPEEVDMTINRWHYIAAGVKAAQEPAQTTVELGDTLPIEDVLRSLCKEHDIEESKIMGYLIEKKRAPKDGDTFEDLGAGNANWTVEQFKKIADFIKAQPAA